MAGLVTAGAGVGVGAGSSITGASIIGSAGAWDDTEAGASGTAGAMEMGSTFVPHWGQKFDVSASLNPQFEQNIASLSVQIGPRQIKPHAHCTDIIPPPPIASSAQRAPRIENGKRRCSVASLGRPYGISQIFGRLRACWRTQDCPIGSLGAWRFGGLAVGRCPTPRQGKTPPAPAGTSATCQQASR